MIDFDINAELKKVNFDINPELKMIRWLSNSFLGRKRANEKIPQKDLPDFERLLLSQARLSVPKNLLSKLCHCYKILAKMLKEMAESTEIFKKSNRRINHRQPRGSAKAQTKYYYKNATQLFVDKPMAFLYVVLCRWAIKFTRVEKALDVFKEIHAKAMDSINGMR